ncbi:PAP-associated domain-containing protein [Plasmodiophora brassicae]
MPDGRRPARRPAGNREAIVLLEEARSLLCDADCIIVGVGLSLGAELLTSGAAARRPRGRRLTFEDAFRCFDRAAVAHLLSHVSAVGHMQRRIRRVVGNGAGDGALGACVNDYRDLLIRLVSIIRTDQAAAFQDACRVVRPPNIFATRDASFVDLPVRRFWDEDVPIGDLADAISVTYGQVAASRSMVEHLSADCVVLHDVFQRAMDLAYPTHALGKTVLGEASTSSSPIIRSEIVALSDSLQRLSLMLRHTWRMRDLYRVAVGRLDMATRRLDRCRSLTGVGGADMSH